MNQEEVLFKQSRVISTSILLCIVGFLMSFVPDVSWPLLGFNLLLATICAVVFVILWRTHRQHSKRYFSLVTYVMLNAIVIYASIPFFRVISGSSIIFWLAMIVEIVMLVVPYFYSENIAFGVTNPSKSKIGKVYIIYAPLVIVLGGIIYKAALLTQNPDAFGFSVFLYLLAILFLFLTPIFLIKPKRFKEIEDR
ncbi:hypothetical protein [Virgibacillus ndiopensis]|uniref:hypothetical protein n=1 Tax=Virgibacillus ndiopensis TaxID=2004408 RepID=UPI000C07F65C|nr:hypothetical protein [Virgibacillus ndiopensis]